MLLFFNDNSMKINALLLIALISSLNLFAQKESAYLLDNFIHGTVIMKNGAKVSASLNYDATNQNMMFIQNHEKMILTNLESIDTIYINGRKFFPIRDSFFLESRPLKNGTIYINWILKYKYQGQKGAYGQISHTINVETINTSHWTNNEYKNQSTDIYQLINENEYWILRNGKFVKCKNKKTLMKLFPEHNEEINAYIHKQNIDFSDAEEVLFLLDFCLGINTNNL